MKTSQNTPEGKCGREHNHDTYNCCAACIHGEHPSEGASGHTKDCKYYKLEGKEICMWCGKTYDEHVLTRKVTDPVPKVPCTLMKAYFKPRVKNDPKPEATEGWEKEFSARFGSESYAMSAVLFHNPSEVMEWMRRVKDFIRTQRELAQQEGIRKAVEEIEEIFKPYIRGYNIDGEEIYFTVINQNKWNTLKSQLLKGK